MATATLPTNVNFRNLTGSQFGRLYVESFAGRTGRSRNMWNCRCSCGKSKVIESYDLIGNATLSCGCLHSEIVKAAKSTLRHGESSQIAKSAEYKTWVEMRKRCRSSTAINHSRYGGRGISVCERWLVFEAFLEDMGRKPSPRHSIDRIDNDGNYEPNNCRWATVAEQSHSRSTTLHVEHNGVTLTLMEWSAKTGIPYGTLKARRLHGWSVRRMLTEPARRYRK